LEPVVAVSIGVLVLLAGTVAVLSRQGILPWSGPALRTSGDGASAAEREIDGISARGPVSDKMVEPTQARPVTGERPSLVDIRSSSLVAERAGFPESPQLEHVPSSVDVLAARLDHLEERLDQIARAVDRHAVEIGQELRRAQSERVRQAETEDARRDATMERLRADLLAALTRAAGDGGSRSGSRRPDVSADLYARLARLEAALAAVTNPILLPGEAYAPPVEFLPEALIWENWNEVGERAFSLADAYSAQRLHLSEQTRGEVDLFVTTLRTLLTRSVYPNLQPEPDATQQAALRAALEEIAAELLKVRQTLEWEYLEGRSI
jgi:hypothetical protein